MMGWGRWDGSVGRTDGNFGSCWIMKMLEEREVKGGTEGQLQQWSIGVAGVKGMTAGFLEVGVLWASGSVCFFCSRISLFLHISFLLSQVFCCDERFCLLSRANLLTCSLFSSGVMCLGILRGKDSSKPSNRRLWCLISLDLPSGLCPSECLDPLCLFVYVFV